MLIESYRDYWKRAFDFKGKTKRNEFWWAFLGLIIVNQIISFLPESFNVFIGLYVLANIIPGLSINIRRLRDLGKRWLVKYPLSHLLSADSLNPLFLIYHLPNVCIYILLIYSSDLA